MGEENRRKKDRTEKNGTENIHQTTMVMMIMMMTVTIVILINRKFAVWNLCVLSGIYA
jgi:hypothetical protein